MTVLAFRWLLLRNHSSREGQYYEGAEHQCCILHTSIHLLCWLVVASVPADERKRSAMCRRGPEVRLQFIKLRSDRYSHTPSQRSPSDLTLFPAPVPRPLRASSRHGIIQWLIQSGKGMSFAWWTRSQW